MSSKKFNSPCDCEDSPSTELPQMKPEEKKNGKEKRRTSNDSGSLAGPNTKPTEPPAESLEEES